jgi:hypothetical protein
MDHRKSTSRYSFRMGSIAIAWSVKKKLTISLSTTKAEYKAMVTTTYKEMWLRRILDDLHE